MANIITLKELSKIPVKVVPYGPLTIEGKRCIEEYGDELERLFGQHESLQVLTDANNPNSLLKPLIDRLERENESNGWYAFKELIIIPEGIFYLPMGTYRLGGYFRMGDPVKLADLEFLLNQEA